MALSTLPAALAEAAAWPAHYQCYYSRKPIAVIAPWSGVLEARLQGFGSHNGTAFVTGAESAPKVVTGSISDIHLCTQHGIS